MSEDSSDMMNKILEEAIKDLVVKKPFTRSERMDRVSSTILQTVGVILTIIISVFSRVLVNPDIITRTILFVTCSVFVSSMICLITSIRTREIEIPSQIDANSYFSLVGEISRINDKKKTLQDRGLTLLVLGIMLMLALLFWILRS